MNEYHNNLKYQLKLFAVTHHQYYNNNNKMSKSVKVLVK